MLFLLYSCPLGRGKMCLKWCSSNKSPWMNHTYCRQSLCMTRKVQMSSQLPKNEAGFPLSGSDAHLAAADRDPGWLCFPRTGRAFRVRVVRASRRSCGSVPLESLGLRGGKGRAEPHIPAEPWESRSRAAHPNPAIRIDYWLIQLK